MNKRLVKYVEKLQAGQRASIRRDQITKAIQEGGFDYFIYRGYDEVYSVDPQRLSATVENIPSYWLENGDMWANLNSDKTMLEITIKYGYSYYELWASIETKKEENTTLHTEEVKEIAATQEGITVEFNSDKNGIEISFESKELATEEIRSALKSVGFRWFGKFQKWIAKQNPETIELVNSLFSYNSDSKMGQEALEVAAEIETIENISSEVDEVIIIEESEESNLIGSSVIGFWGAMIPYSYGTITAVKNGMAVIDFEDEEEYPEAFTIELEKLMTGSIKGIGVYIREPKKTIEPSTVKPAITEPETTIKPYSVNTLKYVNNICETIIEMNWELQEIKISDDNGESCIYGLVKKSNGKTEWEGLYAPSHEKTELQEVFNCLNSRIVKDITIDGMEEVKELSTLETIETEIIDNNKLIIFIEGEGNTPEIKTNDIIKATENLNDRIMKEYQCEYGGYSKTWITITINDNSCRFRYDIDKTMRLTTNILKFMIEQEQAEFDYTMKNIDQFTWLNAERYEAESIENIETLKNLLQENNTNITIQDDPYQRAYNTIEDNNLYEIKADSKTVISDNRYIKNIACNGLTVVTGRTIKELISENKGIDILNLKPLKMNLMHYMEGLKKHDLKQIRSLFPTETDKKLENIKFLDRLEIELSRACCSAV